MVARDVTYQGGLDALQQAPDLAVWGLCHDLRFAVGGITLVLAPLDLLGQASS